MWERPLQPVMRRGAEGSCIMIDVQTTVLPEYGGGCFQIGLRLPCSDVRSELKKRLRKFGSAASQYVDLVPNFRSGRPSSFGGRGSLACDRTVSGKGEAAARRHSFPHNAGMPLVL